LAERHPRLEVRAIIHRKDGDPDRKEDSHSRSRLDRDQGDVHQALVPGDKSFVKSKNKMKD
jgi:hypothetical protein